MQIGLHPSDRWPTSWKEFLKRRTSEFFVLQKNNDPSHFSGILLEKQQKMQGI